MHSVSRATIFSRISSTRSSLFHNGKGRPVPVLEKFLSRSLSTRSPSLIPPRRPLALRSRHILPSSTRYLSSAPPKDELLQPDATEYLKDPIDQTQLNAWDPNFNDTLLTSNHLSIEPHLGYLKELGLDFGWGTTSLVQWLVEHVHVYGGLPWAGTFIVSALIARVLIFPVYARSSSMTARMASIEPILKPAQAKVRQAWMSQDSHATQVARSEVAAINQQFGIKPSQIFLPMFIQIPLGFGAFRLARNMADIPVPGLDNGGFLWFTDLTIPDPYYLIPAITSALIYIGMKKGGELGVMSDQQKASMSYLLYIFPPLSFLFSSFMPAALSVQFAVASLLSLIQTSLFASTTFRSALGMYPIHDKKSQAPIEPYRGTITRHVVNATVNDKPKPSAFSDLKQKASKWAADRASTPGGRLTKQEKAKADAYEKRRREELEEQAFHRRRDLKDRQRDGNERRR